MKSRKSGDGSISKEERIRAEIMETAAGLFQKFGLRKTSLDDIARAMGKRRSFLYYYFESKEDLLKSVGENEIAIMMAATQAMVARQSTVDDKIRAIATGSLRQTHDRLKVFALVSEDLRTGDGREFLLFRAMRQSFHERERALLASLLREGVKSGLYRKMTESVIKSVSSFAVSAMHGIEMEFVMADGGQDSLKNLDAFVDLLLRGLRD